MTDAASRLHFHIGPISVDRSRHRAERRVADARRGRLVGPCAERRQPRRRARRGDRHRRPVRLRQVDAADGAGRPGTASISGTVSIAGELLNGKSEDQIAAFRGRNIGIVFQSFHLIPNMTALENVAVPLELAGARRCRSRCAARELDSRRPRASASPTIPASCRAASSSAWRSPARWRRRPRILIADEPTGNLDQATGRQIADLLFARPAERGMTLCWSRTIRRLPAVASARSACAPGRIESAPARRRERPSARCACSRAAAARACASRCARCAAGCRGFRDLPRLHRARRRGHRRRQFGVARSITDGIADEGQALLGGDLALRAQPARGQSPPSSASSHGLGDVATSAGMRSMARLPDGSDQALVEVKAVDGAYPLYGTLETEPNLPVRRTCSIRRMAVFGAAAPELLVRPARPRASATASSSAAATFALRAMLVTEPDAVSDGFGFAPRLLVSLDGLAGHRPGPARQPGRASPTSQAARRRPTRQGSPRSRDNAAAEFPQAGWCDPHPHQCRAGAVRQHRALLAIPDAGRADRAGRRRRRRRQRRARLSRRQARRHRHLQEPRARRAASSSWSISIQILLIAGRRHRDRPGARRGDAVRGERRCCRSVMPVPAEGGVYPAALALAALFGLLVTLAFALLPLGRARDVPATALFREHGLRGARPARAGPMSRRRSAIALALAGLAILVAGDRRIAVDLRRRDVFCLPRAARRRQPGAVAGAQQPARALDRAAAGARQHPPARRADALGGAVARPRPDLAGHAWR